MINFVKFDSPVRIKEPNLVKSTEGFSLFFSEMVRQTVRHHGNRILENWTLAVFQED